MKKPPLLKKTTDGRIFAYTDLLAQRKDMMPVWPEGQQAWVEPTSAPVPVEGDESLRSVIAEKDKMILSLQRQIDELAIELQRVNEEADPFEVEEPELTREEALRAAAIEILKDPGGHLTSSGKLRIESLESLSGLTGVSAAERDRATPK